MGAKLTIEHVKEELNNYELSLLSETYDGISKDIEVKCTEGHVSITKYKNLKKTKGCTECRRLEVFRRFKKYVDNVNGGHKLITLENEFNKTSEKIKFTCPKDHPYEITMSHFRDGKRCPKCKGNRLSESKRLSKEEVIKRYSERGYEIISGLDDYKNSLSYLEVKCPEGHVYDSAVGNFSAGYDCNECFLINQHLLIPRGENHTSWKGGISPLKEVFRNAIKDWKKESMKASNYKCVVTGEKFAHIHHIYPFHKIFEKFMKESDIPVIALISAYSNEELSNFISMFVKFHDSFGLGVCLSLETHNLFHKIYGHDGNEFDFKEFKEKYSPNSLDAIYYIQ